MHEGHLVEQFEDLAKQKDAARLGMWAFLGSEALLFTGLFALYAAYRALDPDGFAEGVSHNDAHLGTLNTFVLLTSSFLVALAVHEGRLGRGTRAGFLLVSSIALGIAFLIIKFIEYGHHFAEGIEPWDPAMTREHGSRIFYAIYYVSTGLHAVHVTIGMAVLTWLATLA